MNRAIDKLKNSVQANPIPVLVKIITVFCLGLIIQPFIILLIQSKMQIITVHIGNQKFEVCGFLKNIEDTEKKTSYLKGDAFGILPFTGKIATSTLIEILRISGNDILLTPGKYAVYESWKGIDNNEHSLYVLFQYPPNQYVQMSFYGVEKKVFRERLAFIKQIDRRIFHKVPFCELSGSFQKAYNAKVINRLIHSYEEDRTLFEYTKALELNDKPKVLNLLSTSDIVDKRTDGGYTPLHIACLITEDTDIIKTLIEKGLDVDQKNPNGYTPLMLAAFSGRSYEIASTLIEHGANVNISNSAGETALYLACYSDNLKVADALIKNGAQLEKKDELGLTPLHIASYYGNDDIINLLITAGADVNAKSKTGLTPLHLAAISGDVEALKLLIQAGANTKTTDNQKMTCFHKSAYNANSEAMIFLANDKELVNLEDYNGKTAYEYAKVNGMGK